MLATVAAALAPRVAMAKTPELVPMYKLLPTTKAL
jgi:hypothetical protein